MNKYTADELNDILEKHAKWLKGEEGGCRANLDRADLRGSDLNHAKLIGADLIDADLRGSDLIDADLREADLSGAKLSGAKLIDADLRGADLSGAKLSGATLNNAVMSPDTLINFPLACPDEGAFIGWKKCYIYVPVGENAIVSRSPVIVKLCILNDAKRSSATGRKCRCDRAQVLDIQDMHGNSLVDVIAYSSHDHGFTYAVGKVVSVDTFDDCRWHECAPGIHFFITKQEALEYNN